MLVCFVTLVTAGISAAIVARRKRAQKKTITEGRLGLSRHRGGKLAVAKRTREKQAQVPVEDWETSEHRLVVDYVYYDQGALMNRLAHGRPAVLRKVTPSGCEDVALLDSLEEYNDLVKDLKPTQYHYLAYQSESGETARNSDIAKCQMLITDPQEADRVQRMQRGAMLAKKFLPHQRENDVKKEGGYILQCLQKPRTAESDYSAMHVEAKAEIAALKAELECMRAKLAAQATDQSALTNLSVQLAAMKSELESYKRISKMPPVLESLLPHSLADGGKKQKKKRKWVRKEGRAIANSNEVPACQKKDCFDRDCPYVHSAGHVEKRKQKFYEMGDIKREGIYNVQPVVDQDVQNRMAGAIYIDSDDDSKFLCNATIWGDCAIVTAHALYMDDFTDFVLKYRSLKGPMLLKFNRTEVFELPEKITGTSDLAYILLGQSDGFLQNKTFSSVKLGDRVAIVQHWGTDEKYAGTPSRQEGEVKTIQVDPPRVFAEHVPTTNGSCGAPWFCGGVFAGIHSFANVKDKTNGYIPITPDMAAFLKNNQKNSLRSMKWTTSGSC